MSIKSLVHLGVPIVKDDGQMVIFAIAHADLTAYQPYAVNASRNTEDLDGDGSNDNDGKAVTAAPATLAVKRWIGAPQRAYSEGEVAELMIGGAGKLLVTSATVAATNYLEVLNGGTAAINAGGNADEAIAYACEGNDDTAQAINVQFLGYPAIVKSA